MQPATSGMARPPGRSAARGKIHPPPSSTRATAGDVAGWQWRRSAQREPAALFHGLFVACLITLTTAGIAAADDPLARAIAFHASFDAAFDADFSRGDPACRVREGKELVAAAASPEIRLVPGGGRFGGAIEFPRKGTARPQYAGKGVLGYAPDGWSTTVSAWLRLDPDKDLEPGYCDPVQIEGDDAKKGFVFLEWSKDETPRLFRLAIRPLFHIWNPDNVKWADIPFAKRPMVQVEKAPFGRDRWTHVAFTVENVNVAGAKPTGRLFIDGACMGAIENWDLSFGWAPGSERLVIGAAYVGLIDDLAVFDRALSADEVARLHRLPGGVRDLRPAAAASPAGGQAARPLDIRSLRGHGGGTVDTTQAPDWWVSRPDEAERLMRSLPGVEVFEIGRSAGGRPILAAACGEREDLPGRTSTSLASAIAGGDTRAFYGRGSRSRQGFLFLGGAHGTEFDGTVAALNLLNVIATGSDLRGRAWPRMAEIARRMRVVVIPFLNMDGRERFRDLRHLKGVHVEDSGVITTGRWKDGTPMPWPKNKLHFPVPLAAVDILGSYYNDAGVNLVYDDAIGGSGAPETVALVRFLREELPDCVVCSHSNHGSLVEAASSYIPTHFRQHAVEVAALVGARCHREGKVKFAMPSRTDTYAGQTFYQTDVIHHVCGALPLVVEFPSGYENVPDSFDEMLDIGMLALEEIVAFGDAYRFRPKDPKSK